MAIFSFAFDDSSVDTSVIKRNEIARDLFYSTFGSRHVVAFVLKRVRESGQIAILNNGL